jgi:hypothetical protein
MSYEYGVGQITLQELAGLAARNHVIKNISFGTVFPINAIAYKLSHQIIICARGWKRATVVAGLLNQEAELFFF